MREGAGTGCLTVTSIYGFSTTILTPCDPSSLPTQLWTYDPVAKTLRSDSGAYLVINYGVITSLDTASLTDQWDYNPQSKGLTIGGTGTARCLYVGSGWIAGPPAVQPVYLHSITGNDPEGSCGDGQSQWNVNHTAA